MYPDFVFYFPMQAIVVTVIALGLVFLAIAFFTPKLIRKKEVVRLLKTEVTGEKPQKLLPFLVIFLILLALLTGILVSKTQTAKDIQANILTPFAMLITVVIGTYLLFAYGMRIALALSKNSKANGRLLYRSDKQSKMRANTQAMTISAVLYAVSFFAIIILFSMSTSVKEETEKIMPYAMSYNAWTENADVSGNLAVIEKELQNLPGYQEAAFDLWYSKSEQSRAAIISAGEYNKMMEFLDREPVAVSKDGVFLVTGNAGETLKTIPSAMQTFFAENGLTLSVEGNTDSVITLSGFTSGICVLNDAVFEALQPQMKNTTITVFHYDNWETNSRSPEVIKEALKDTIDARDANVINAYSYYHSTQLQNNLTLYIGGMLCFTFILAVASFIYSRLYSELEAECKKYKGIVKIGLSKKELSAALNKVTSLILWVPFLVAVAYLWIGIAISERYVIVSNVPVALRCTLVLFVLQIVIYSVINASYRKAVFRKVYQEYERG